MKPKDVEGFISNAQGDLLAAYASQCQGQVAVEVGSYRGKSASYIAAALPDTATLYCVDPWQNSPTIRERQYRTDQNYAHFVANIEACGLSNKVVAVQGFSSYVASQWDKQVSFLHLDGGHEYDEVLSDLDCWMPHMAGDGIVVFDDYSPRFPGIEEAVHKWFDKVTLHNVGSYPKGRLRWFAVGQVADRKSDR